MTEDREVVVLRECLAYIRAVLKNNTGSPHDLCETIDRAIGPEVFHGGVPTFVQGSFGRGGASMAGIPGDPTKPANLCYALPIEWRGPAHDEETGAPE